MILIIRMKKNDDTKEAETLSSASQPQAGAPEGQPLTDSGAEVPSRLLPADKRFGREISFGIQQTLACWATDFIDPYVGKWYQNRFGNKQHEVTNAHTWGGEVMGDSAAFFVYLGAKRMLSKPIDAMTQLAKKATDPLYDRMGRKSLKDWRKEHHISKDDPRYLQRLENYKEFQAENLVDSTIIASSSTVINVAAQRALGNKQGIGLILTSKLIGAVLTMGSMLGLRSALPESTKTLDDELSERYFSKVVRAVQRLMGAAEDKPELPDPDDEHSHKHSREGHHAQAGHEHRHRHYREKRDGAHAEHVRKEDKGTPDITR